MNIYTFLMSKDKCQTFFPKLQAKNQIRGNSNRITKKMQTHKLRNRSIEEDGKLRLTYHDILHVPISSVAAKQKSKQQKYLQMRSTFVQKPVTQSTKINGYQILKQIGKGGFAQVVQVEDDDGNHFAMKQYVLQNSIDCFKNQCIVGEHFFEQGRLKNKFTHNKGGKNLIKFIEKIKTGKKGYIIQELGGKSLSKTISEVHGVFHKGERVYEIQFTKYYEQLALNKKLTKLLLEIAESVKLLNSEGFIHCDLKPENVLVNFSGNQSTCKIIDFGSAFLFRQGLPKITITPQYMPPELLDALQSDNSSAVLSKIDIWSLGCIILEIVTGIPLWFRYKCKININGRQNIQLGFFALTNRQYRKIIKKQKQICQSLKKINFTYPEFQIYRKLLLRTLVFEENERATIDEVISMLDKLQ